MKTRFRAFLIAVLLALTEGFAGAQQSGTIPRVGFIVQGSPDSQVLESFRWGLRELGYIEGQNIIVEPRFDYGNSWRLDQLVTELVQLRVNVIVVGSSSALFNVMSRTKTIPVVMQYVGDPVAAGVVASVERPGGNVTGIGSMAAGLGGKWLELLKEAIPAISRVGVLYTGPAEEESPMMKELEVAARSLRVELQPARVPGRWPMNGYSYTSASSRASPAQIGGAFRWATRGQADAFIILPAAILEDNLHYIAGLARNSRLPGIFWQADFAAVGGLMAYGANQIEQSRRAAYFVDKILKGAKPAELPVETAAKSACQKIPGRRLFLARPAI
jgi:putative tryptophan/tyrosine transport system substrate-binding protein